MMLVPLLFLGCVFACAWLLNHRYDAAPVRVRQRSIESLRERLARGEISRDEYCRIATLTHG